MYWIESSFCKAVYKALQKKIEYRSVHSRSPKKFINGPYQPDYYLCGFIIHIAVRTCHDIPWYLPISFGAKYPISANQSLTCVP